ncbi:unannotated protein [freshwater metagenome]|uniref:Unannotated protein n=1 Tax=freshwater metagenome TaxID=449393 RepID=A0A6J7KT48_9ZZZZ|nr:DUF2294 family protein [Actinomycetota bacterium]
MPTTNQGARRADELRAISDAISRITRDGTGRGPVHARAIRDDDAVVVLLSGGLTKGEQSLVDDGRPDAVLALRREFQDLLRPEYVAAVEEITGRRVVTFMSTNTTMPDHAAEIFLLGDALEPAPDAG